MRKAAAILTLAIAVGPPLVAQTGSEQSEHRTADAQLVRQYRDAEVAYSKARERFDRKNFEGARNELGTCFELIPVHADGHLLMAKMFYVEKEYVRSLAEVERARSGHEAIAAIVAKMQEERMSGLRERVREKDDSLAAARAQRNPGQMLSFGPPAASVEKDELNRILNAQRPSAMEVPAEYAFFHGNVLLRMKRLDEATVRYEEALRVRPSYSEAANNLAALYVGAGRYEQALEVVSRAESAGATVNPEMKRAIASALQQPR